MQPIGAAPAYLLPLECSTIDMPGWCRYGAVMAVTLLPGCGRIGFDLSDDDVPSGTGSNGTGTTVTVSAVADTALSPVAPTTSAGGSTSLAVRTDVTGSYVGLVRFELPSVTGAALASATLRITTSSMALPEGRIDLAKVLEDWDEGVATYSFRQTLVPWTAVGCGAGSREQAVVGALKPTKTNTRYDVALSAAAVQAWLDEPASNHGLALVAVNSGSSIASFFSRESDNQPELVLEFQAE